MIDILRRLVGLHEHKWEKVDELSLVNEDSQQTGKLWVLRCEHCGAVKKFKVKP